MLILTFEVAGDLFGLATTHLREITPLADLEPLPLAPKWVAGIMNYRGLATPVLDLTRLASGEPSETRMSTRIVVVDYALGGGDARPLGLMAEKVTNMADVDPDGVQTTGVSVPEARFMEKVVQHGGRMIRLVEVAHLLPGDVRALLFRDRDGDRDGDEKHE